MDNDAVNFRQFLESGPDTELRTAEIVEGVIQSRCSIRAFVDRPVSRDEIAAILNAARFAPSGTNTQPWKVYVVTGASKNDLCWRVLKAFNSPAVHSEEYAYYPGKWRSPYIDRRRRVGYALYSLLGIDKRDTVRRRAQESRNFLFFDAPVGLIFTIDRDLGHGSWLDYGMFLQNIMLSARARGLDTCPQAAFNRYHRVIADTLGLPDEEMVLCAMAVGYRDPEAAENRLLTERCGVEEFSTFLGFE